MSAKGPVSNEAATANSTRGEGDHDPRRTLRTGTRPRSKATESADARGLQLNSDSHDEAHPVRSQRGQVVALESDITPTSRAAQRGRMAESGCLGSGRVDPATQ